MTEQELKDLLLGSIIAFAYQSVKTEEYRRLLKTDSSWQDAVHKSEEKLKSMICDIKSTINNDFTYIGESSN